jgi:hypothetical protein
MNRTTAAMIFLALVAGGLGVYVLVHDSAPAAGVARDAAVQGATRERTGSPAGESRTPPGSAPRLNPAPASARAIRIGDPMYGVRTQAEADWLNRNRFPLVEAGFGNVPTAADLEGPLTADAIHRAELAAMLRPELRERALERLRRAAEDGSIAALRALSQAYEYRKRDVVMADAYARAAEMRGDWNPRIRTYELDPLQATAAPILAHRILHDIDRARRVRGLPPLVRDERPGLVETSDGLLQAHRAGELRVPMPPRP